MPFTHLQNCLKAWMPTILNHPFNRKLADGSLPINTFNAFLALDKKYLREYANALNTLGNRLQHTHPQEAEMFYHFSNEARNTETHLHEKYLKRTHGPGFFNHPLAISDSVIYPYIQHLHLTTKTQAIPVAIASVLPCYVIYRELGLNMPCHPEHRYHRWIASYSSLSFLNMTKDMIMIFNAHSLAESHQHQEAATMSFITSLHHELHLWDSVCNTPRLSPANHEFTVKQPYYIL